MYKNQAHRSLIGRFVLSFMLFAWANAYAAPCLMAMDDAAGDGHAAHTAHDGHGSGDHASHQDAPPDCDHCPPGGHDAERCATGISADCGAVPDFGAEFRKSESKLKDLAAVVPPSGPVAVRFDQRPRTHAQPDLVRLLRWRADPPLFIQHDAYLK